MSENEKTLEVLTAATADRHLLYESAVQQPQVIMGFIEELFEDLEFDEPQSMREDFCGTANLSSWFIRYGDQRTAIGVDNDPEVLEWGRVHNRDTLGEERENLTLVEADIFDVQQSADIFLSLNFSHTFFKTRAEMKRYLQHAYDNINSPGMLLIDAYGGPGSMEPCTDERDFGDFKYIWEQKSYNPLTNEVDCGIHFAFPDGSVMQDAFTYDWRLWSLPELQELLKEVGFDDIGIYFESENGFVADVEAHHEIAWVAYVVAVKMQ